MLYVTYKQNGQTKRATISRDKYEKYAIDISITDLQIHSSQLQMENAYSSSKGGASSKRILLG